MDNIVYNETRTACLKQHSIQPLNLAKDSENPAVELYASKFADFRALPGKYDKEVIKAISAVLKANEIDEKERFRIYMIPKYDRFFNEMSMLVKLNFSQGFVDKLCTIVAKPIIRIVWKIQTVGYPNAEKVHDGGNLDVPLKAGQFSHEIQGFGSSDVGINVSQCSFMYSVIMEWKEFSIGTMSSPSDFLRSSLGEKLWNEMPLADCTIVSSDGTENKCHRNVLAVHSDVLHTMLKSDLSESQTNRIEMDDISQEGVAILLSYMYGRDLQLNQLTIEVAIEVLKTTHKYNISNLEAMLLNLFYRKSSDWFSIHNLMTIYFFSVNVSEYKMLSEKLLFTMKMKQNEIRTSPFYEILLEYNPRAAANLAWKLLEEK